MNETRKEYKRAWRVANNGRQRAVERRTTQTNKIAAIVYKGGRCLDCGFDDLDRPEVFEFDHLPGFEKKYCIGEMATHSAQKRQEELDKCDLVCANCHNTRTRRRQNEIRANNTL